MNLSKIDFYVPVIDNLGDVGFALNLGLAYHFSHPEIGIRFFVEDPKIYTFLTAKQEYDFMEVRPLSDLSKDPSIVPSEVIFNFFNLRIDEKNLSRFPFAKTIINFDYLQFHPGSTTLRPGVKSLHLTESLLANGHDTVIHYIPSLLTEWGGVIINAATEKRKEAVRKLDAVNARKRFLKESFREESDILEAFIAWDWHSVFLYPKNLEQVVAIIPERKGKEVFWVFERLLSKKEKHAYSWIDLRMGTMDIKEGLPLFISAPFMQIEDYLYFLSLCDTNFVRGENSFVASLVHGKPTLWDIYKEDNNAHKEKLWDFIALLRSHGSIDSHYSHALEKFNQHTLDVKFAFHSFLDNQKNFLPGFWDFCQHIHKNCDLIKKLEKLVKQ